MGTIPAPLKTRLKNKNVMPIRIQRKRTKGWKMPDNTVYVGRPTKWGNPFKVTNDALDYLVKVKEDGRWSTLLRTPDFDKAVDFSLSCFKESIDVYADEHIQKQLRGKNLACFCSLDQKCHADILLEIANQ